jgi:hypothetical protein
MLTRRKKLKGEPTNEENRVLKHEINPVSQDDSARQRREKAACPCGTIMRSGCQQHFIHLLQTSWKILGDGSLAFLAWRARVASVRN